MRVGIVHPMAFPEVAGGDGPITETLKVLLDDEVFDVVEVTSICDSHLRPQVRRLFEAAGKTPLGCAQPLQLRNRLDLNSFDKTERQRALAMCKDSLSEAGELGAAIWSFLSGPDPQPTERDQALELLLDSVAQLCAHARTLGNIQVALETFDREIEKKAFLGPNSDAASFARQVRLDYPNFGLVLDMAHIPLQGESFEAALQAARDEICLAHLGNCVLCDPAHTCYGDKHPRFGIEGGENDVAELAEFLLELNRIGYLQPGGSSIVSFEMRPTAGESSQEIIENAKSTLARAWPLFVSRSNGADLQ